MNYATEAAHVFCKNKRIDLDSMVEHENIRRMIDIEAQNEIDRGTFKGQRNQYSKALDIALERFTEWYDTGLKYRITTYHEFLASHRQPCVFAVLLKRSQEGMDKIA